MSPRAKEARHKKQLFDKYWPSQKPTYASAGSGKMNLIVGAPPAVDFPENRGGSPDFDWDLWRAQRDSGDKRREIADELSQLQDVQERLINSATKEIRSTIKSKHAQLLEHDKRDREWLKAHAKKKKQAAQQKKADEKAAKAGGVIKSDAK